MNSSYGNFSTNVEIPDDSDDDSNSSDDCFSSRNSSLAAPPNKLKHKMEMSPFLRELDAIEQ